MQNLNDIKLFAATATRRGFSVAARVLDIVKSKLILDVLPIAQEIACGWMPPAAIGRLALGALLGAFPRRSASQSSRLASHRAAAGASPWTRP